MTKNYLAAQMLLHPETRILVQRQQDDENSERVHEGLKESRMQALDAVTRFSSVLFFERRVCRKELSLATKPACQ